MTSLRWTGLCLLLGLMSFGACDSALSDHAHCSQDSECGADRTCAFGYCIAEGSNRAVFGLRIKPSEQKTGLLQQQLPDFSLSAGPAHQIKLLSSVELKGMVVIDALTNVEGSLEAKAAGEIEGYDYRFTAKSVSGLRTQDGFGYSMRLLPGRDYGISFRPEDDSIPLHRLTLPADDVTDAPFDIQLPQEDQLAKLEGFVRREPTVHVGGARVVALLEDGSVASSTFSDVDKGHFRLSLPPGTAAAGLRVEPPEGETDWLKFRLAPRELGESWAVQVPKVITRGDSCLLLRVDTDGDGVGDSLPDDPDTGGVQAEELKVTFTLEADSTLDPETAESVDLLFSTSENSDTTGRVEVADLPQGDYLVTVVPPAGSTWRTIVDRKIVWADMRTRGGACNTLVLEPRGELSGVVLGADGQPVSGGSVYAYSRDSTAYPTFQTSIDADGSYSLRVDPGFYDLRVVPGQETGAPPKIECNVSAATGGLVRLDEPGLAHITVLHPDGSRLSDVTVEVFSTHPDCPARLLTKGTTDSSGAVDLLVPFEAE